MSVVPDDSRTRLNSLKTLCASLIAEEPWIIADRKPNGCTQEKCKIPVSNLDSLHSSDGASLEEDGAAPSSRYECREEVNLPLPASEAVFEAFYAKAKQMGIGVRSGVLGIFFRGNQMPLEFLNLELSNITDENLIILLQAHSSRLRTLNLTGCDQLTPSLNSKMADVFLAHLDSLNLGSSINLFSEWPSRRRSPPDTPKDTTVHFFPDPSKLASRSVPMEIAGEEPESEWCQCVDGTESAEPTHEVVFENHITGCCPNLKMLTFHYNSFLDLENEMNIVPDGNVVAFLIMVLDPVRNLEYLDISLWEGVEDMRFLRPLSHTLHTLLLYNIPDLHNAVNTICELRNLKRLDVSQASRETGTYPRPATTLDRIARSLTHLTTLDISSTNLAAAPSGDDWPKRTAEKGIRSDIVGLRSLKKPLDFLGLFGCDAASHFRDIPAINIAGDANEEQVLLSLAAYSERVDLVQLVLNETYQVYRFGQPQHYLRALKLVVDAMYRYVNDGGVQIAGSASLFYIIRNVLMNAQTKRRVIVALLSGMENHFMEQVMVRNCCLSLCQFDIPQELLFDYERAARLLIQVMNTHETDQMTQRIVIYLLNAMACHVEGEQKVQVGRLGAIECILGQIRRRLNNGVCDEVMEVAWSFLWNITDETAVNCQGFLKNEGMDLFYQCYQSFPDKRKLMRNMMGLMAFPTRNELVRNMMGLMGNIAETELKIHLMRSQYITVFSELLVNEEEGIEISYNSAGVLAHLCSQGESGWSILNPSREETMDKIVEAIRSWKLDQRRFINYRSFGPILRLLPLEHSPASRHWASWALANLTTVDGPKYCAYVEKEGGIDLLRKLAKDFTISEEIRFLADIVLKNVDKWRETQNANADGVFETLSYTSSDTEAEDDM